MHVDQLDCFDKGILSVMQSRGDASLSELSSTVNLSASQCSRRLQRLKDDGYIEKISAILSPKKLNLAVSSFVVVKLRRHSPDLEERFHQHMQRLTEVALCHYITGSADYMLLVFSKDLESYKDFLSKKLLSLPDIDSITSHIILSNVKSTTVLPLDYC